MFIFYFLFSWNLAASPSVIALAEAEMKSVSVMEGDSVTLNPDLTQIQGMVLLLWRFGEKGSTIAQIDGKYILYEYYEVFRDRLQLDQTGSLTITNVRTNHSGLYKAEVSHNSGTSYFMFKITVYESPSVIAAGVTELKLMSVTEGDSVTLHVPQIQGDELIVWRFGDEGKLIAKADIEAKSSSLYDETDERFRDRLKLDQTGSLIITNTRTTDSGEYKVKISSNKQTLYKRFTVTVSVPGLSGGAKASIGIVIGVLLAAAAAGVIYYFLRRITTNLPNQTWRVIEGDYITLNPETEIQRGDEIQWLFGDEDTLIAEIKGENREMKTYGGPDEIFMYILKQGETPGSLTITDIKTKHTGLYTLKIRRGRETLEKRFMVYVEERKINVLEGKPVTLEPVYEIKKDDLIHWLFGDEEQQTGIAEFNVKTGKISTYADVAGGRFRDRLELDKKTGSLTINNTRTEHTGVYKLEITSSSGVTEQTFTVTVRVRYETVTVGEPVRLYTQHPENKTFEEIRWLFGDENFLIAEIKRGTGKPYVVADERFRDKLELNEKTGDLTIMNSTDDHSGHYKLKIRSSKGNTNMTFSVIIRGVAVTKEAREKSLMKEKSDSRGNRGNESATVVMEKDPLLDGDYVNVENEEGMSSL